MTPVSALASGPRRDKLVSMLPQLMAELVQLVEQALHAAQPPIDLSTLRGLSFGGEPGEASIYGLALTPKGPQMLILCLRQAPGALAPELVINGKPIPCTRSRRPAIVQQLATLLST
jgi:hypothetical protein